MIHTNKDIQMLVPMPWCGRPQECDFDHMRWAREIKSNTFLALWLRWPDFELPMGYDSYLISFHLEAVDCDWLDRQSQRIHAPIVVLHDGDFYDWPHAANVHPTTYIYWHHQLDRMLQWFGPPEKQNNNKTFLASAYCSRITQSKLLIFTALAEYIGRERAMLTLANWLEEKNVHDRQPCGVAELDRLADIFYTKYYGLEINHDDYTQSKNYQAFTANYKTPAYHDCALHFTNESYHYSLMNQHIRPGPFVTEKTLKCLLAKQAFIPVGQFDTYGCLSRLGFNFDYGFDTSWDGDPGNLTRLLGIVTLIKQLSRWSIDDIVSCTAHASRHNIEHILSGQFAKICQDVNEKSIHRVFNLLK